MPENPLQAICQTFERVSKSVQTQATQLLMGLAHRPSSPTNQQHEHPLFSLSSSPSLYNSNSSGSTLNHSSGILNKEKSATPVTREELGRATWTLLHTLAAQYPDKPTRQQKKDVKELMGILSRIYPCKECADHFKEVLRY
ncbi:hypothetical protein RJ639_009439 [Escallonia herrerae]|uniref:Sulfhydryl oxidase n=1 Tax=Escallonia herrerae TaxID=1293975 RepID=A0AA88VRA5_9ASTE|nr:hypothetical protein RJ639_009439 [Escallonia herrerae]